MNAAALAAVCAAALARDAAPCARAPQEERARCAAYARVLPAVRAWAWRDPAFPSLCAAASEGLGGRGTARAYAALCREWGAARGGPRAALAAAIADVYDEPPPAEELDALAAELTLERDACAALDDGLQRAVCVELADLKAAASGGPARCRGPLCRALAAGDASSCAEIRP